MRRLLFLALGFAFLSGARSAAASDWVALVFPERSFDFGTVARGSQLRHSFPVVNRTNSEVRIADVRTKCGCTNVRIGSKVIPPGTKTTVEATLDTTKFLGYKGSGLTLILDEPVYANIDLNLSCFIRGDITLSPGQLDFGVVRPTGKLAPAVLTLTYSGGRSDWEITHMQTQTAGVKAEAREISRTADGQIHWRIEAALQPGIKTGYFKDEVAVLTNDANLKTIPICVVASIQGAVTVLPSVINFGPVRPGEVVSRVVHVRSSSPFSITRITANRTELEPIDSNAGSFADHAVNLKLKVPSAAGPYHAVVKVETDVKDEPPVQIKTFATVASPQ
jgi:hypothetical protein